MASSGSWNVMRCEKTARYSTKRKKETVDIKTEWYYGVATKMVTWEWMKDPERDKDKSLEYSIISLRERPSYKSIISMSPDC